MDNLKVGMYVRTRLGFGKVISINAYDATIEFSKTNKMVLPICETNIIKLSFYPANLLEIGDIIKNSVLGVRDIINVNVEREEIGLNGMMFCLSFEEFNESFEKRELSIVTKEQFEAMSYKIGENYGIN